MRFLATAMAAVLSLSWVSVQIHTLAHCYRIPPASWGAAFVVDEKDDDRCLICQLSGGPAENASPCIRVSTYPLLCELEVLDLMLPGGILLRLSGTRDPPPG